MKRSGNNAIPGWLHIRSRILDLDDYVCRICFVSTSYGPLHVHHIDYNRSNNEDSNLVTLCNTCHKQVHFESYKPSEHEDWPIPWKLSRDIGDL